MSDQSLYGVLATDEVTLNLAPHNGRSRRFIVTKPFWVRFLAVLDLEQRVDPTRRSRVSQGASA